MCLNVINGNRGLFRTETRIISLNEKTLTYEKVKRVVSLGNYAKITKRTNKASFFICSHMGDGLGKTTRATLTSTQVPNVTNSNSSRCSTGMRGTTATI